MNGTQSRPRSAQPETMRAIVFATFAGPLFVGMAIVIFGAGECLRSRRAICISEYVYTEPVPDWLLFGLCGVLATISLISISRRRQSESAFGWLFFFGLFCLGLSLVECRLEWRSLQEHAKPYYWVDIYAPRRILMILSHVIVGVAHIIAALLRDYFYPVISPASGTLSKSHSQTPE